MDFAKRYAQQVERVEQALDRLLPAAATPPPRLHEAMRYAVQAGGKRLRPVLVLAAAELADPGARLDPLPAAVAVECVHTYSLVHDDLPCMDDDDLRRGRPTCHKAFDEATALLAGDALLTHAFALLSDAYRRHPRIAAALTRLLGEAAGSTELIGGQMLDLLGEHAATVDDDSLRQIHRRKTAAMIRASLLLGATLGGAPSRQLRLFRAAGEHLGLAFQIVDDILDVTQSSEELGKTAGKDAAQHKITFPAVYGLEASHAMAEQERLRAHEALAIFGSRAALLAELADFIVRRKA